MAPTGSPGRGLLVGDIFRHAARATPHRPAAALGDEQLTFAEIEEQAGRVRCALRRHNVGRGDRMIVWCATALEVVPIFAGAAQAGVVFVPVNPQLGPDEAAAIIAAAKPALVVSDGARSGDAHAIARQAGAPCCTMTDLLAVDADPEVQHQDAAGNEADPHVVFFTSGSTGQPKGVVLSHRVNVLRSHPGAQFERRGTAVCTFPLFHMAAWTIALGQWHARDAVVFVASATADTICSEVSRHQATRLNCVPAVWRRVLDFLDTDAKGGLSLASLRFADTGTSATPPALLDAMQAALPEAEVRVFYGSTEAGNVTTLEHQDLDRKPGRVGVPSVSTELRLDGTGELLVRSPLLCDGYFDDEGATADAFVDGWYRTGDLAEVDEDGYISIVGRVREVIRTGGESVSPVEVERALADHAAVADVAVIGRTDADWGEVVCAVVVVAHGCDVPTVDDLAAHAGSSLARFKQPRAMIVVDAIPRTTATGQIQRRLLDQMIRDLVVS